jgi:hypothetical protein
MTFVSTGISALDSMIAGRTDCRGFPRDGLSLFVGPVDSGKTELLTGICGNAHRNRLKVVFLDPYGMIQAQYPVREVTSLEYLEHMLSKLLHPGNQKHRADLVVVDAAYEMIIEKPQDTSPLTLRSRILDTISRLHFGNTALVMSWRRNGDLPNTLSHRASLTLGVSRINGGFNLEVFKSRWSDTGVSCTVNPGDLIDRSKIPNRYERILRGRD